MAEDGEPKAAEERGTKKIQRRAGFSSQENRWLECTRVNGLGSCVLQIREVRYVSGNCYGNFEKIYLIRKSKVFTLLFVYCKLY